MKLRPELPSLGGTRPPLPRRPDCLPGPPVAVPLAGERASPRYSCCRMPAVRRSMLRFALLLAALALLLPLAALADSCTDCLWSAAPDGCAPTCCPCCVHGGLVLTFSAWGDSGPVRTGLALDPKEEGCLSMSPRDVFHVPKTSV
jgi:hypothetical protein